MNDNLSTIVEGRVCDGILFAEHRDRLFYIRTLVRNRPQWLKENAGRWRYIKDIQRETASLAAPVESEVNVVAASSAPNGQMSSYDARKDCDDEDDVALVDTLTEDRSPPHEPASPPTPVNEKVPSEPTQAELQPPAKAASMKTKAPKTGATPTGATGRKQGRAGGRPRKKRKLSAKASKARRRVLAERMRRMRVVLDNLSEYPIQRHAARKAGIHRKTLENWIKHSKAGDDGYDIEHEGVTMRFHVHCEWSKEAADDKIEEVAWERAKGELYKDGLGNEVPHLYIRRPDAKMIRFLLERKRPEKWGKHPKIDTPQKTGVVLVSDTPKKPAKCPEASIKARKWKSMAAMVRKTKS
jgi:hypothetical protein